MFLLPDSNDWNESSKLPSISLTGRRISSISFYHEVEKQSTHPRSASALPNRSYNPLTPLDALFAISRAFGPVGLLLRPPVVLCADPFDADVLALFCPWGLGLGIGLSGPPTAHAPARDKHVRQHMQQRPHNHRRRQRGSTVLT